MNIQTGRDPFARHTIHRRNEYVTHSTCAWCGQQRRTKSGRAYLYQYFVGADSERESGDISGLFCGIGCVNAYHN